MGRRQTNVPNEGKSGENQERKYSSAEVVSIKYKDCSATLLNTQQ